MIIQSPKISINSPSTIIDNRIIGKARALYVQVARSMITDSSFVKRRVLGYHIYIKCFKNNIGNYIYGYIDIAYINIASNSLNYKFNTRINKDFGNEYFEFQPLSDSILIKEINGEDLYFNKSSPYNNVPLVKNNIYWENSDNKHLISWSGHSNPYVQNNTLDEFVKIGQIDAMVNGSNSSYYLTYNNRVIRVNGIEKTIPNVFLGGAIIDDKYVVGAYRILNINDIEIVILEKQDNASYVNNYWINGYKKIKGTLLRTDNVYIDGISIYYPEVMFKFSQSGLEFCYSDFPTTIYYPYNIYQRRFKIEYGTWNVSEIFYDLQPLFPLSTYTKTYTSDTGTCGPNADGDYSTTVIYQKQVKKTASNPNQLTNKGHICSDYINNQLKSVSIIRYDDYIIFTQERFYEITGGPDDNGHCVKNESEVIVTTGRGNKYSFNDVNDNVIETFSNYIQDKASLTEGSSLIHHQEGMNLLYLDLLNNIYLYYKYEISYGKSSGFNYISKLILYDDGVKYLLGTSDGTIGIPDFSSDSNAVYLGYDYSSSSFEVYEPYVNNDPVNIIFENTSWKGTHPSVIEGLNHNNILIYSDKDFIFIYCNVDMFIYPYSINSNNELMFDGFQHTPITPDVSSISIDSALIKDRTLFTYNLSSKVKYCNLIRRNNGSNTIDFYNNFYKQDDSFLFKDFKNSNYLFTISINDNILSNDFIRRVSLEPDNYGFVRKFY